MMIRPSLGVLAITASITIACGSSGGRAGVGDAAAGGTGTTGGIVVGGTIATGGSVATTGGAAVMGGTTLAGGGAGGRAGAGATISSGGSGEGGVTSTGGTTTTGGSKATGGVGPAGGTTPTGGSKATGGTTGTTVLQGVFVPTGSMTVARARHTATLLPNGTVLIAGGAGLYEEPLASAEIYDPSAGTFTPTGSLTVGRISPTATLLPSGKVLIAGGQGFEYFASAELYDPSAGTFTAAGSMGTARARHTATLLLDGKVLISGGYGDSGPGGTLPSAELYDPAAGTFGSLIEAAWQGPATALLLDGKVLVAGDDAWDPFSELYDPASGIFTATGSMIQGRQSHTATLLPSGRVLIAGGDVYVGAADGAIQTSASAELYNPVDGTFAATGNMTGPRKDHKTILLPNGQVLIAGGWYDAGPVSFNWIASAELYDPATGGFTATGSLTVTRVRHTATLLPSGKVLIAGGSTEGGNIASAELYEYP